MCYHDLIPWVPDLPVAGCVHTPSRLSRSTASAACGFLYSQRTAKTDPHGSHPVSRGCETLLPSDMAFSSRFFLFARKKTAQARRARRRTEKIHDEKAYFRKTSCQNRKPVVCYGQGAGHPVVGCVHTLLVCRAPTRQAAFYFITLS